MDSTVLTFPLVAGIIVSVVTSIINRVSWDAKTKNVIAFATAAILTAAGVGFQLVPDAWTVVASFILAVYGVSQAVWATMKPLLRKLEIATSGKAERSDEVEAIIDDARGVATDNHLAAVGEPARGKHDLDPDEDLDDPTGALTDPE